MKLSVQPLTKEEIDLFNREDERAFNVHSRYFPDGIVPGAAEEDRDEYDLGKVMKDPRFTVLSIKDDGRFIGGAIVEDRGGHVFDIGIFFLTVEYQGRGIGKTALEMVEDSFPDAEAFTLVTPSQVIRNAVFYVNKCGYKIVKVVDFDRESNTADYVFEKRRKLQ